MKVRRPLVLVQTHIQDVICRVIPPRPPGFQGCPLVPPRGLVLNKRAESLRWSQFPGYALPTGVLPTGGCVGPPLQPHLCAPAPRAYHLPQLIAGEPVGHLPQPRPRGSICSSPQKTSTCRQTCPQSPQEDWGAGGGSTPLRAPPHSFSLAQSTTSVSAPL